MTVSPHTRPFRFGLQVRGADTTAEWLDLARKVEAIGFDTLTLADHIGFPLWTWSAALSAAAVVTSDLRFGTLVIDNDLRNPAMLAAEIATVDIISGGRFEAGIGAGWDTIDYTRTGIPFDPPAVRMARMKEALAIIKGFLSGETVNFSGEHYHIEELTPLPRALQTPHPPILIGAGGRRMLELAAREADIASVIMQSRREGGLQLGDSSGSAYAQKIDWLHAAAGDRWNELEINALIQVFEITDSAPERFADLAGRFEMGAAGEAAASPHLLIGSLDQIVETMLERREKWGISYYMLRPTYGEKPVLDELAQLIKRLK